MIAGEARAVVAAVVAIVRVEVAPALVGVTDGLSKEHVGASEGAGVTEQVSGTAVLKPFVVVRVIVAVADPPAVTDAGEAAPAASVKLSTLKATADEVDFA
jgi:hypothetical protein